MLTANGFPKVWDWNYVSIESMKIKPEEIRRKLNVWSLVIYTLIVLSFLKYRFVNLKPRKKVFRILLASVNFVCG